MSTNKPKVKKPWNIIIEQREHETGSDFINRIKLEVARALYKAMKRDGAIKHQIACEICGGVDYETKGCSVCGYEEGECKRDCPACRYERLLGLKGRMK